MVQPLEIVLTSDRAVVLVADLVTSRRVANRAALHERLQRSLEGLEADKAAWVAPLVPVKGIDELSGVLAQPARAFDLALKVNLAVWPERFRYALAEGAIDVAFETRRAPAMDGSAFHRAADALARARSEGLPFTLSAVELGTASRDSVEALLALHAQLMRQWTPREAEAVLAYRRHDNQSAAAQELGVSQQAISDALKRASHPLLVRAEDAARARLAEIFPVPAHKGA